jgi:MSHA biogenesis protein MshO
MVMSITIIGVLFAMVATYLQAPISAYIDADRRARLTDAADGAFRRIARDIHAALPNSIRGPNSSCFEFIPVIAGGRYRAVARSSVPADDILDFTAADTSLDVLGQIGIDTPPSGTKHLVVYNLGISNADAYADAPANNRAQISTIGTSSVTFAAKQFPYPSPSSSFHVIPDYSVVYSCSGGRLLRSTQAIASGVMASCPSSGTLLADNVVTCNFSYAPALSQRNGLLSMRLELGTATESVRLYQEVHVNNVP